MKILGIESSCDETAIGITDDGRAVASAVASQVAVHERFGGVVPEIAAREHLKALDPLMQVALDEAKLSLDDIDAFAVTQGPGLIGALLVGVSYARALALGSGKPLVPINHVHAHIHGALLDVTPETDLSTLFPCLALVVSGGHTHLYHMHHATDFRLLAQSIDDACGEAFDKVARLLGLPGYPGGAVVERWAQKGDPDRVPMPKMIEEKHRLAFSYSGLKTHVAQKANTGHFESDQAKSDLCAAFQREALGQIVRKLEVALDRHPDTRSVIVAGGVAANKYFRQIMEKRIDRPALFPSLKYCGDNGAMISALAYHQLKDPRDLPLPDLEDWDVYARYNAS